jgi:hypothetical protein
MNAFVFVITIMANGVINSSAMELYSTSAACIHEQQTIVGINRANIQHGIDVLYFGECRAR